MKQWLPSVLALAGSAFTIFSPALQGLVASHPAVSMVLAAAYAVISHILPSPVADPKAQ